MECGNFVTVNDLWSPIPYMECKNLVMGSPHMYDVIFQDGFAKRSTACPISATDRMEMYSRVQSYQIL